MGLAASAVRECWLGLRLHLTANKTVAAPYGEVTVFLLTPRSTAGALGVLQVTRILMLDKCARVVCHRDVPPDVGHLISARDGLRPWVCPSPDSFSDENLAASDGERTCAAPGEGSLVRKDSG
jgi:hypothetical protein